MKYKVNIQTVYEVGRRTDKNGCPHQEDYIIPLHGQASGDERLFILCDGMGGHEAGEVASQTVCEAISHTILTSQEPFSDHLLQRAIEHAYDRLDECEYSADVSRKMGTTLTLLALHENGATIAHIGDSRVYHIRTNAERRDEVLFQTHDHSLVNDLIKIGSITPEQAKHHPQRNIITRAMQPGQEERCSADIYHTKDIRKGDYFFLCSDGMLEEMENENLCNILSGEATDAEKAETLRQVTANNKDNHSAILVHILDVDDTEQTVGATAYEEVAPAERQDENHDEGRPMVETESPMPIDEEEKRNYPWVTIILVVALVALAMIFLWK